MCCAKPSLCAEKHLTQGHAILPGKLGMYGTRSANTYDRLNNTAEECRTCHWISYTRHEIPEHVSQTLQELRQEVSIMFTSSSFCALSLTSPLPSGI
jgi:hypothetical protein